MYFVHNVKVSAKPAYVFTDVFNILTCWESENRESQ